MQVTETPDYATLQRAVDLIHDRMTAGEFVSIEESVRLFGKTCHGALMHELHLMHSDSTPAQVNDAIRWIHITRHFEIKAQEHQDRRSSMRISRVSLAISIVALVTAMVTCARM